MHSYSIIIVISLTSRLKKKKKKKDRPTGPPNFQAKRANKPLFFRLYVLLFQMSNFQTCQTKRH